MDDTPNNSEPLIPADAPDDYIVDYEIDGTPILLKDFLESAERGIAECRRGYYYTLEGISDKYDAYFNASTSELKEKMRARFVEMNPAL